MKKTLYKPLWSQFVRFSLTQSLAMLLLMGVGYAHPTNAQEYLKKTPDAARRKWRNQKSTDRD